MPLVFRGRTATTDVAIITSSSRTAIMHPGAACEGCGGMAEMAIQIGGKVVEIHTDRRAAVAALAIVDDAGMVKHRTGEGVGIVANATILTGRNMAN